MLKQQIIEDFIDTISKKLQELGVDTTEITIDHLGYQADSKVDYDAKTQQLDGIGTKVSENIVGGRRVGIFKLNSPLIYKDQQINVVEVFEPKDRQIVKSAWEHIEFLLSEPLEDFAQKYQDIDWDTSMINRDEFPMLILSLGDGLRAKFPRLGVLDEIKRINKN